MADPIIPIPTESTPAHESSLWLVIDGYNVIAPAAAPRRGADDWLRRERRRLLDRIADAADEQVRRRTCVVFDAAAPPAGRPHRLVHREMTIRFAVDYPEADDLVEAIIAANSAPKRLMVVSSDRRLMTAASRRGCDAAESQPWFDNVIDGRVRLAAEVQQSRQAAAGQGGAVAKPSGVDPERVDAWLDEFGL